jgi:NAD(P)-dependent dehydrogenase (short-subunit alcohol dehydrogenase family)
MMELLEGKNVFITGTNRGIGRAMLTGFAENGANIWAHARSLTPAFQTRVTMWRRNMAFPYGRCALNSRTWRR